MLTLFVNPPCRMEINNRWERFLVRSGSRWRLLSIFLATCFLLRGMLKAYSKIKETKPEIKLYLIGRIGLAVNRIKEKFALEGG